MVNIQHYLISGRFITTIGHFIALLILFSTINNNINVSLSDNHTSTERRIAVNTSWVIITLNCIMLLFFLHVIYILHLLLFN